MPNNLFVTGDSIKATCFHLFPKLDIFSFGMKESGLYWWHSVFIFYSFMFKNGPFLASSSLFSSFLDSNWQIYVRNISWPISGFKLRISGVRSDRSANCTTTTAFSILSKTFFGPLCQLRNVSQATAYLLYWGWHLRLPPSRVWIIWALVEPKIIFKEIPF